MHGFGAYVKMRASEIDRERMSNPPLSGEAVEAGTGKL